MRLRKRMLEALDQDIRDHIEAETKDNIERGMPPTEARHAALRKFGNVAQVKEDTREVWSVVWLEQILQDIRYALRTLRRNPGFTAVVILTLALGIGMNTAVFSVVNAVLLRPVGYPNADRLVWLADYAFKYDPGDNYVGRETYLQWRDRARSFESMTAFANQDLALAADGEASQESIASITGDFWSIMGAQPAFGRLFRQGEPNALVLSNGLFERRFGSDRHVIGKALTVNGYPFTITGVLPREFRPRFPPHRGEERREVDAYIPIPDALMRLPRTGWQDWEAATQRLGPAPWAVSVVGKLKPNVSFERARTEMEIIWTRVAQETCPAWMRDFLMLHVVPFKEKLVGNARRALMILLAAVAFVLLIASANVANLLLARASARRREIAIRAAMGAGRARVIRQFLAESVLLALVGGAAGLVLARWSLAILVRLGPEAIPRLRETQIDIWVLLFTLAVSLATGILFGLGPALSLSAGNLHDALKDDPRAGISRLRVRGWLGAAELALAIVLLTGAGLMLKSFWRMNASPPGFAPGSILVMRVPLSGPQYNTWPPKQMYMRELLSRIESAPGVQASGIDCGSLHTTVKAEGASQISPGAEAFASVRFVSPGYLRAMGVPLVQGHWPTGSESLFAIVVNESLIRTMGIPGNPIGRRLVGSFLSGTIVGVIADFKSWQLDAEPSPEVYYPYERSPFPPSMRVVVRTSGDARAVAPSIRKLISDIDRTQPVYEVQTLEHALSDSIAPRRFNLFLLGAFAATALLMALVGIYGVIAYSVRQRTHEIGIRMALGAGRGEIVRMVVRQGMGMALTGIAIGLAAALGLTRLMASLLYDVKANDPPTFAAVALTLALTALLACWAPALKAALVDPNIALRHE